MTELFILPWNLKKKKTCWKKKDLVLIASWNEMLWQEVIPLSVRFCARFMWIATVALFNETQCWNYLKFVFIFWLAIVKLLLTAVRLNNKITSFFLNMFVASFLFILQENFISIMIWNWHLKFENFFKNPNYSCWEKLMLYSDFAWGR